MKILLVCSGGMSSAIVAKALQDAGTKEGLDIQVDECGTQDFAYKVKEDYHFSIVAPQILHLYYVFKASSDEAGVPCLLIKPQGYTPLGGPKLLQQIKEELEI